MTYPSYFIEVVRELYSSGGWVKIYLFHAKFGTHPSQIGEVLTGMNDLKLIQYDAEVAAIRLTPEGFHWVDAHAEALFMAPRAENNWRRKPNPKENDVYIPDPRGLEREFLTKLGKQ